MLKSEFMSCHRAAVLAAVSLLLAGLVSPLAAGTPRSWLIDPAKFHISAHGQLPCATCHDSVAASAAHPDPRNVNQPPARPDPAAGCLQCHETVQAALAQGRHGRMTERQAAKFRDCVSCHNPHTAIKVADRISKHITAFKRPQDECGACHAARQKLPKLAADDAKCMSCHEGGAVSRERDAALCIYCHGDGKSEAQIATGRASALINASSYGRTPHAGVSCATCHPGAAAYGHAHQPGGDCLQCHAPHYSEAHDPHVNVDCRACHVSGGRIVLNAAAQLVVRERVPGPGSTAQTHSMVRHPSRQACDRCHFDGNRVGASAMALPAKSVLCMGCHASTLSVGDAVTIPSLVVFLLGLAVAMSLWLSGAGGLGGGIKALLSPRILLVALQSLLVDSVLQWRLLRQSVVRWAIHLLIFLPLVIRFAWGAAILALSWTGVRGMWFVALVDKNHPVNALLLDGTGVLIVVGFVLEGMRITMTGASGGWAFLGYAISRAFTAGPALARSYGYVWYLHAALTGAFVAYLPFSRMFHILVAPVVLAGRAVRRSGHAAHSAGD